MNYWEYFQEDLSSSCTSWVFKLLILHVVLPIPIMIFMNSGYCLLSGPWALSHWIQRNPPQVTLQSERLWGKVNSTVQLGYWVIISVLLLNFVSLSKLCNLQNSIPPLVIWNNEYISNLLWQLGKVIFERTFHIGDAQEGHIESAGLLVAVVNFV